MLDLGFCLFQDHIMMMMMMWLIQILIQFPHHARTLPCFCNSEMCSVCIVETFFQWQGFYAGHPKFSFFCLMYAYLLFVFACISLGDDAHYANFLGFHRLATLLPNFCQLSVPEAGVCGAYSESP